MLRSKGRDGPLQYYRLLKALRLSGLEQSHVWFACMYFYFFIVNLSVDFNIIFLCHGRLRGVIMCDEVCCPNPRTSCRVSIEEMEREGSPQNLLL